MVRTFFKDILVEGNYYKVVENLGFQHSVGKYVKIVKTPDGERAITRFPKSSTWKWHEVQILFGGPVVGQ
jgi:hypothetical protein